MTTVEDLKKDLLISYEQIGYTKEQALTMVEAMFGKVEK